MISQAQIIKILIFSNLILFSQKELSGQIKDIILEDVYINLSWNDFVSQVESKYHIQFYFDTDSLANFNVNIPKRKEPLLKVIDEMLIPYNHTSVVDNAGNIIITKNIKIHTNIPDDFFMKKNQYKHQGNTGKGEKQNNDVYLETDNGFISNHKVVGKKTSDKLTNAIISGYVKNINDNLPVVGATLQIKETKLAVVTNESGFYTLHIKKGKYTLTIRSVESKEEVIKLEVLSSGRLDIDLESKLIALDEIIISSEKEHIVRSTQMGYQKLETKEIKEIPLVLGERDVIKVSLLLPGVQSVGEGSAGFNVRGSPTDQNLFVINSIPIYNSSHLLGFFSVFNSDAIEHFSLYKSNIPIQYGGRLASIFDIRSKQGNKKNFTASGGISPITTRLLIEGPIKKNSSSYMVGLRSSYSDWVLKRVKDDNIKNSNAQFADLITNFSFKLNENNRLEFSSYHSYDKINLISKNKYNYSNNGGVITWNHLLKKRHNLKTSLIYSQYNFVEESSEVKILSYKDNFDLKHSEFKVDLTVRPNSRHTITAGLNTSLYQLDQGSFLPLNSESLIEPVHLGKEQAVESGVFLSDEWVISSKLSLIGGLRYNGYVYLGPQSVNIYNKNASKSIENIVDTVDYTQYQIINFYGMPDLRFSARYILFDNLSLKLSFNQLKQYLFMLTNSIAISPTDKWKLSDFNIKPMSGYQYSFGVYKSFFSGKYDVSIETYYKGVDNLAEYRNGANLLVSENLEMDILQGSLESYGVELMLKKTSGRFNGWINYTYSRALVTVNSLNLNDRINNGEPYPSNYDKPHAINLVANYKFSRRFSLSANTVYSTGRPITYPIGVFYQEGMELPMYSKRNEYRVPDYFRVDFSLKFEGNLASEKLAHGVWIFSVYNLTGRKNAYSVYFKSEEGSIKGYKLSVFGTPIISLTYSFKLGNYAD